MIWLNGALANAAGAVSAADRGLLLGEGVFETVLAENGTPSHWAAHMERLWRACDVFGFTTPYAASDLHDVAADLMSQQNLSQTRAVIRVTVTGGDGGRGLVPTHETHPNWLVQASKAPDVPAHIRLMQSHVLQPAGQILSPIKTTNYAAHIFARKQALSAGADDAILVNQHQRITGVSAGNIFALYDEQLITPQIEEGALPGITRARILALGDRGGHDMISGQLSPDMLNASGALIVCNAVMGVVAASLHVGQTAGSENLAKKIRAALTARS